MDDLRTRVLRELLETRIVALEKQIDFRLQAVDKALSIQVAETARRLGELNHEQARIAARDEKYLPREIFDRFNAEMDIWRAVVDRRLAGDVGRVEGLSTAWTILIALVGAMLAGLAIWLRR